jgi:hypothetical protein
LVLVVPVVLLHLQLPEQMVQILVFTQHHLFRQFGPPVVVAVESRANPVDRVVLVVDHLFLLEI